MRVAPSWRQRTSAAWNHGRRPSLPEATSGKSVRMYLIVQAVREMISPVLQ